MIGIDDEDEISAQLAQSGIVNAAEYCLDIVDAALAFTALDFVEHFLLNVDSVHNTIWNTPGDAKAKVARTGAYVRDGIVCFDRQRFDQQIGTLVSFAAWAVAGMGINSAQRSTAMARLPGRRVFSTVAAIE